MYTVCFLFTSPFTFNCSHSSPWPCSNAIVWVSYCIPGCYWTWASCESRLSTPEPTHTEEDTLATDSRHPQHKDFQRRRMLWFGIYFEQFVVLSWILFL
ncbi:hypothetical protein BDW75DRAFT_221765 [Aspergillus navahoensis]